MDRQRVSRIKLRLHEAILAGDVFEEVVYALYSVLGDFLNMSARGEIITFNNNKTEMKEESLGAAKDGVDW